MNATFLLKAKDFLRDPKCLAELNLDDASVFFVCQKNALHKFPIINGIISFVKR